MDLRDHDGKLPEVADDHVTSMAIKRLEELASMGYGTQRLNQQSHQNQQPQTQSQSQPAPPRPFFLALGK